MMVGVNYPGRWATTILAGLEIGEEISFEASDVDDKKVVVDAAYVNKYLGELVEDEDLSRYIL